MIRYSLCYETQIEAYIMKFHMFVIGSDCVLSDNNIIDNIMIIMMIV